MKRWIIVLFIVVYMCSLGWGVVAHTLNYGSGSHPMMYFLVWDMFCGWSAYSARTHIIGEGESGTYYELAPGPWGELHPYGDLGRQHYDSYGAHSYKIGMNTLKHTEHEPMTRLFVVEELWAKKFNMPQALWKKRFEEPKQVHKYYHVRHILTPDGIVLQSRPTWLAYQYSLSVSRNPRLQAETRSTQSLFITNPNNRRDANYNMKFRQSTGPAGKTRPNAN